MDEIKVLPNIYKIIKDKLVLLDDKELSLTNLQNPTTLLSSKATIKLLLPTCFSNFLI